MHNTKDHERFSTAWKFVNENAEDEGELFELLKQIISGFMSTHSITESTKRDIVSLTKNIPYIEKRYGRTIRNKQTCPQMSAIEKQLKDLQDSNRFTRAWIYANELTNDDITLYFLHKMIIDSFLSFSDVPENSEKHLLYLIHNHPDKNIAK